MIATGWTRGVAYDQDPVRLANTAPAPLAQIRINLINDVVALQFLFIEPLDHGDVPTVIHRHLGCAFSSQ